MPVACAPTRDLPSQWHDGMWSSLEFIHYNLDPRIEFYLAESRAIVRR